MAQIWPSAAPYPNWSDYATSLDSYANEVINREEHRLSPNVSLVDWFRENELELRANPYQRALNGVVAVQLLPVITLNPSHWQSIRYMPNTDEPFSIFVSKWYAACPEVQKGFPALVAQKFGIHVGGT
jgi:hypothetical protein